MDSFLIISVGELNANKNNQLIIKALAKTKRKNVHYVMCGVGNERNALENLAEKLNVKQQVHFLGYRNDVMKLYQIADIFAMPSYREGLPRSLMEAMAVGLPCIVSDIRGNCDLIEDGKGGYLVPVDKVDIVSDKILELIDDNNRIKDMRNYNFNRILEFDSKEVNQKVMNVYLNELT